MSDPGPLPSFDGRLAELREEIDRIDAASHALLIERSAIIDALIAIKARQGGGSAFRPGREAEMMRRLVDRHLGRLPLDTVEGIWRVVIATFTFLQSAYAVHVVGHDPAVRDGARFHFGFTVPLREHPGPDAVVAAVAAAEGDLGLLRIAATDAAWWRPLVRPGAPRIIARLPFVERPDHPTGTPVFVLARPGAAAECRDVAITAVRAEAWDDTLPALLAAVGSDIVTRARDGTEFLVATPAAVMSSDRLAALLHAALGPIEITDIGAHPTRFVVQTI